MAEILTNGFGNYNVKYLFKWYTYSYSTVNSKLLVVNGTLPKRGENIQKLIMNVRRNNYFSVIRSVVV